jgi:hypothetical protein
LREGTRTGPRQVSRYDTRIIMAEMRSKLQGPNESSDLTGLKQGRKNRELARSNSGWPWKQPATTGVRDIARLSRYAIAIGIVPAKVRELAPGAIGPCGSTPGFLRSQLAVDRFSDLPTQCIPY